VSAASDPISRQVAMLLEMFPNVGADCGPTSVIDIGSLQHGCVRL